MPSLLEALEQKYGDRGRATATDTEGSEEDEGISVSIFIPRKPPRVTVPSLLVLNDCDITTAGDRQALVDKVAAVEELDLAKNKLEHWPEVLEILKHMPKLKFVNLSFNCLAHPLDKQELDDQLRWQNLRNLVLNSTKVPWKNIQRILNHLPSLEELHLSLNEYDSVDLYDDTTPFCACENENTQEYEHERERQENLENSRTVFDSEMNCNCGYPVEYGKKKHKHLKVKKVHFTGNPVSKWQEICKIGIAFPNLESLVVAECPIRSLEVDSCDEENQNNEKPLYERSESGYESDTQTPHDSFPNLKFLNLNSTQLSTWDDIERLSKFPALHCLRVQGCPLWESHDYTEHERRQLLIARLPNVEMLNGGGTIDGEEREDSERAFIRYYMDKPESDRPERYFELVRIHGKLDPLVNVDLRPEKRVNITFTCGNNSETRSVDVYRTVSDLKSKLEGFAGFSASKMRLFYVDQDLRDIQGPEEMKYPHKQLYSYNIRSGDEIIIDCKRKIDKH